MNKPTNEELYVIHTIVAGTGHANDIPSAPVGRKLERVWTLIDHDKLRNHGPEHNASAFLEDRIHDWRIDKDGKMRFYSRVVPTGDKVQIVLDYETSAERNARLEQEKKTPAFDPMTGKRIRP